MTIAVATRRLFCFGTGYVAGHLAHRLIAEGWTVGGTARSAEKVAALQARGIEAIAFGQALPPDCHHVLVSVPPDDCGGDAVLARYGKMLAGAADIGWLGYLSSSAPYGNHDGARVDESTVPRPTGERGERRLAAEQAWLSLGQKHGLAVHIFRLAGIYGPGRNPFSRLRAGTARRIIKPGQVFSRIHVDDLIAVLMASMARPRAGAVYNVGDDEPAPPQDVVAFAATLLGLPAPPDTPFEKAALSSMGRSFYADNKRLSNRRIKQELGVRLRYPSYREGLGALYAAGGGRSPISESNSST